MKETIEFKAEVAEVLNLVIHSLYSHREVFLRELVSNAADAIDKRRFEALTNASLGDSAGYEIRIVADKKRKLLTIRDNGIGMTREELVKNIGTIAASGSKAFLEKIKENQEASKGQALDLIGRFGVGFYSAFMAANKVEVWTKSASGTPAMLWISEGKGGYTLEETEKEKAGTDIILHLKEDADEFLEDWRIREVVQKYSDYVSHPIHLEGEKEEVLNKTTAIWRRPKADVKNEEYEEFYKYISHDTEPPLAWTHHTIEGGIEFRMLLFIPQKAPMNLFHEEGHSLRLHVKKMFVTEDLKDLLPLYLRFVRGVVDSEDLPLNVSRETLQHNALIPKMRKQLVKKVLELLEDLAKNQPEKYAAFWKEFGVAIKEGVASDFENRDRVIELLRFQSSKTPEGQTVSLADYAARMKEGQKDIYYIAGANRAACERSPHMEAFRSRDIEVFYMVDVVDEWMISALGPYKEKKLHSATRGDLDLSGLGDAKDKKETEKQQSEFHALTDKIRSILQEQVKEVRVSSRLSESPACLVADEGGMDANMERILKAMHRPVEVSKRVFEINPTHPVIANLKSLHEKKADDARLGPWIKLLYNQALLAEGSEIPNPSELVSGISSLLEEVSGSAAGKS
ncbi:MAG: molecular chaperone HtpG [Candidatus Omnitrophica bacterium]|nr:molecular chaperone HtpG [Candidatus Omnitrophota bacterium]